MKKVLSLSVLLLSLVTLGGCGETTTTSLNTSDTETSSNDENTTSINSAYDFNYEAPNDDIGQVYENASGAYYEVFVYSFYDSDGDGIGDINGVSEKLDYLKDLGISGIWLMPISPSPSYHKYDVTDYKEIDPQYGTLDDFKNLLEEAHKRDIKVIIDMVINHTSDEHPWFELSYQSYMSGSGKYAEYYNWYDEDLDGSQSKYSKYKDAYYESQFSPDMPDLNLDSNYVREEVVDILTYWLNLGVDGYRLDTVINYYTGDETKNIDFLNFIRETCKSVKEDVYIVGEAWTSEASILNYSSTGNSYFAFNLSDKSNPGFRSSANNRTGQVLAEAVSSFTNNTRNKNSESNTAYFISNHDNDRWGKAFSGEYATQQLKLTSSLYLLSPGNPFIYYGEEIALNGTRGGSQTDANRRLHMIWDSNDDTGETNDPPGADYDFSNQPKDGVNQQLEDKTSVLYHYKKIINLRNKYGDLFLNGSVKQNVLPNNPSCFSLNYSNNDVDLDLFINCAPFGYTIDLSTIYDENTLNNISITDEIRIISDSSYIEDNLLHVAPFTTLTILK